MEEDKSQGETINSDAKSCNESLIGLGIEEVELFDDEKGEKLDKGTKMLRSWKDIARRARIFEYCKVENPNEVPAEAKHGEDVENEGDEAEDTASLNENSESLIQGNDSFETRTRRQSVSSPFNFPQKPIEQIEMLRDEVNLELKSSNEKPTSRSPLTSLRLQHHEMPDTILEETEDSVIKEEDDLLQIPLPLFQRLSLLGDNFSGVNTSPIHET